MPGKTAYAQVHPSDRNEDDHPLSAPAAAERIRASRRSTRTSGFFDDGWATELICVTLGTVLIIALCLVLRAYDGHRAPRFGSAFGGALTINTVVAIISASAKAALLLPVAECVSQFKWLWFTSGYRRLSEISTFDKASRGILGGLELLWRTKLQ